MSQIILTIRQAPRSEPMLRWQMAFNAAFAGGSLGAAVINLGAMIALSIARSVLSRLPTAS